MKKFNQSGFMHWTTTVLPLVVIAGIAVIGVKILTASHAATPTVLNGKIVTSLHEVFSPALVKSGQFTFANTATQTCNMSFDYPNTTLDGKTSATVCYDVARGQYTNIAKYTSVTGANFKVVTKLPAGYNQYRALRWQKAKVGTKNIQLVESETEPGTSLSVDLALYDSVTWARKVVTINGSTNTFTYLGSWNYLYYDWSADGKKILVAAVNNNSVPATPMTVKMCSIDVSTATSTITCGSPVVVSGTLPSFVRWSHDSSKIIMSAQTGTPFAPTTTDVSYVITANADMSGVKTFTSPKGVILDGAVWSPDGTAFAVRQYTVSSKAYALQTRSASTFAVLKKVSIVSNGANDQPVQWLPQ